MLWLFALTLFLGARADECTTEEVARLFFALEPDTTVSGDTSTWTQNFPNDADCDAAQEYLSNGVMWSNDFLEKFCGCAVWTNKYVLDNLSPPLSCTINGQDVNSLDVACDDLFCNNASPLTQCTCDAATIAEQTKSVNNNQQQILDACTNIWGSVASDPSVLGAGTCACWVGYPPMDEVKYQYGCRFATDSSYQNSLPFYNAADYCDADKKCRDCFPTDNPSAQMYYDIATKTCNSTCGSDSLAGCITSAAQCETDTKPYYLGQDCPVCTTLGYKWSTAQDQCFSTCPAAESCVTISSFCPNSCTDGTVNCGDGRCAKPGYCWCDGVGYGTTCETDRNLYTISANGNTGLKLIMTITGGSPLAAGTVTTFEADSGLNGGDVFEFSVPAGNTFEIDIVPLLAEVETCYFVASPGGDMKTIGGTAVAGNDVTATISCFAYTAYQYALSLAGVTRDNFLPYKNSDLISSFLTAYAEVFSEDLDAHLVNLEDLSILTSGSGVTFRYETSSSIANAADSDSVAFNTALETAMSQSVNLAQFWETTVFSLEFTLYGIQSFTNDELVDIVAAASGIVESGIQLTIVPIQGTNDAYQIYSTFSSSEEDIDQLILDVSDGTFQTNMESEMAQSNTFSTGRIEVTNTLIITFTISNVNEVNEEELKTIFVAEVPYANNQTQVSCTALGTGNHQCTVVFSGDMDDLSSAQTTVYSTDFQDRFAGAIGTSSMNGASVSWTSTSTDESTWTYSYALSNVVTMNKTELISLTSTTTGMETNQISLTTVQTGSTSYTATVIFSGTQAEIISVQNAIISGAWATNMQAALTESTIFSGAILGEATTTSVLSWLFYMQNVTTMSYTTLNGVVANAFGLKNNSVSTTGSIEGGRYTVNVVFEGTTSEMQVVALMLATGSYQTDLESGVTNTVGFENAVVTYSERDDFTVVYYMYDQAHVWLADFIAQTALHFSVSSSIISVIVNEVTGGFELQVSFAGGSTDLYNVLTEIDAANTIELQQKLRCDTTLYGDCVDNGSENGDDVILQLGVYDMYVDCQSFYFFYEGACEVADVLDIMFVVDSSNTIDEDTEFSAMLNWLTLVHQYSMPIGTKPALLQFATATYTRWDFNEFDLPQDETTVVANIEALSPIGGATFTDFAVNRAIQVFDATSSVDRRKVMVLMTDGQPTAGHQPCDYKQDLVDRDITVMVIGIGSNWTNNIDQVSCIATEANEPYVVSLPMYNELSDVTKDFNTVVCPGGSTSPFDGTYYQSDYLKWNDRFIFTTTDGLFQIVFAGAEWRIQNDQVGVMISVGGGSGEAPAALAIWNFYYPNGTYAVTYDAMLTDCTSATTDTPTRDPVVFMSNAPTVQHTDPPTDAPSTAMPSVHPTIDDCQDLIVYRYGSCAIGADVDIIFIVDSSESVAGQNYVDLKAWLTMSINNISAVVTTESVRMGLMQFGSESKLEFYLGEYGTFPEMINHINEMDLVGGATYTKEALDFALNPANGLVSRSHTDAQSEFINTITILVTDGQPTSGHEICVDTDNPASPNYINMGVVLSNDYDSLGVLVIVGEEFRTNNASVICMATYDVYVSDVFSQLQVVNLAVLESTDCTLPTPFDGPYGREGDIWNDEYVYRDHKNREIKYQGNSWTFLDPLVTGTMIAESNERSPYPADFGAWRFFDLNSQQTFYSIVRIVCTTIPTPTVHPTTEPTDRPTLLPSGSPTMIPSDSPFVTPTDQPSGDSRTPTKWPSFVPSTVPVVLPTTDCDCKDVFGGICEWPFGLDYVFAVDSHDGTTEADYDFIKEFFKGIVLRDDLLPNPLNDGIYGCENGICSSTLGTVKFADTPIIDFNNGDWDNQDEWIEYIDNLDIMNTPGYDIAGAIRTAIYDMYPVIGEPRKDKVLVILTGGDYTGDDPCELRDDLQTRGILTVVIAVGGSSLDGLSCVATSQETHFARVDSYDQLSTIDIAKMLCQDDLYFEGEYQRTYPNSQKSDGSYIYVSNEDWVLEYVDEEFWQISGDDRSMIARLGDPPFPPDKHTWDYVTSVNFTTYYHVRILCCKNNIPTRSPTNTPSVTPTVSPSCLPTTDTPTTTPTGTPSVTPTNTPTTHPTTYCPSVDPTSVPSGTPSVPPTGTPSVTPTKMPTAPPTTKPTVNPTTQPVTSPPTTTPSFDPSTPPTFMPTDDCECFIVGECLCYPTRYDPPVCFYDKQAGYKYTNPYTNVEVTLESSGEGAYAEWVVTKFNGRYCRTEEIKNGRPVYKNKARWEIWWTEEQWLFEDPFGIIGTMGEILGGIHMYPDTLVDWIYISETFQEDSINDLTICCSNTSYPTCSPSPEPSVMPTVQPTNSPTTRTPTVTPNTALPTTSPSTSPSPVPVTSLPTNCPSVSPTPPPEFSVPSPNPTVSPTVDPSTGIPTVMPTTTPTTIPSPSPNVSPTKEPSSSLPSVVPTVHPTKPPSKSPMPPPSKSPTVTPTKAPTNDCIHFIVGYCPCLNGSMLDVVFLVDSSNSVADSVFYLVTGFMQDGLRRVWPENAKLGFMDFGTIQRTSFIINNTNTTEEWASIVENLVSLGGGTWTQNALTSALEDLWIPYIGDNISTERERITMLFTDGQPTSFQNPCLRGNETKLLYDAYNIDIWPIVFFTENWRESTDCLVSKYNTRYFPLNSSFDESFGAVWQDLNLCRNKTASDTPYNGGYSRTDNNTNGRPTYEHSEGWIAYWSGEVWTFVDPNRIIGPMAEAPCSDDQGDMWCCDEENCEPSTQIYPVDDRDWSVEYKLGSGVYSELYNIWICCVPTATPTRTPSVSPTVLPSVDPSVSPTVYPTVDPSVSPTEYPHTTIPSVSPTVDPSVSPTPFPHTTIPSVSPSVDPTVSPSTPPTSNMPSTSPSPLPSWNAPSVPPTTTLPTVDPSVRPSVDPTVDPTVPPSYAPTDFCYHFCIGHYGCYDIHGPFTEKEPYFMWTPYNGGYSITDEIRNGKPVYRHSLNFEVYWDEVWTLYDPSGSIETWTMFDESNLDYPESWKDWIWTNSGNFRLEWEYNVTICCKYTPTPTRPPSPAPSSDLPSVSPSTDPSVLPTVSPSVDPTVDPSVSPSVDPTVDPSVSPSVDPSVSPTPMPTDPYPSVIPTVSPSVTPSTPPTTNMPSVMPTVNPSVSPTVEPTFAPTNDCEYFIVGWCPCVNISILDVQIILDGSKSITEDDWNFITTSLPQAIIQRWPNETARLGYTLFSSDVDILQNLRYASKQTHASVLEGVSQPKGTTHMKEALLQTYNQVFKPSIDDGEIRERFVLFFTDGEPSEGQSPCDVYTEYYEPNDIIIIPVCVGDLGCVQALDCLTDDTWSYIYTGVWEDYTFSSAFRILDDDCNVGTRNTPYNGWYERTGSIINYLNKTTNRPVYRDTKRGFEAFFDNDEAWTFVDYVRDIVRPMAEQIGTFQNYPITMQNWTHYPADSIYQEYLWVIICCVKYPTPTCEPSVPPTVVPSWDPSVPPTVRPSVSPTTSPSVDPSVSPTVNPSVSPSVDPSVSPTVDPSVSPSVDPSVVPTVDPSVDPTVDPSTSPTVDPSVDPSVDPTVSPSVDPSVIPTVSPSVDPTVSPTCKPSTTEPSYLPTTSLPTPFPHTSSPTTTAEPSDPPSVSPTPMPHTSLPSVEPTPYPHTTLPSVSPSVDPTVDPSTSPTVLPSVSPSVMPTWAPSNPCVHFYFCHPCSMMYATDLDTLFIVDSSTSISDDDFYAFQNSLAQGISMLYPAPSLGSSKLGYMIFASTPDAENVIDIYQRNNSDHAALIRVTQRIKGATMIQHALLEGLEMWTSCDPQSQYCKEFGVAPVNKNRTQMTVIVTDGEPSAGQNPCGVIPNYVAQGIDLVLIGMGEASNGFNDTNPVYDCFKDYGFQTFGFTSFQAQSAVDTIFGLINVCDEKIIQSPYDGPYGQCFSCPLVNSRPVYKHSNNYILQWQIDLNGVGFWEFSDPSNRLGRMLSTGMQNQLYPVGATSNGYLQEGEYGNWTYLNFTRTSKVSSTIRGDPPGIVNYTCPVYCQDTITPTRMPSPSPSRTPSSSPSTPPTVEPSTANPTVLPTVEPSTAPISPPPSVLPTVEPSPMPNTAVPTLSPSTELPTVDPSVTPTVDPTVNPTSTPTVSPSVDPTVDPTVDPSTSPSLYPTTNYPTTYPSVDPSVTPTASPSVSPTLQPLTTSPSLSPTAMPSVSPSEAPSKCDCPWDCWDRLYEIWAQCTDLGKPICHDYQDNAVVSCDECYQEDIEDIRTGLGVLSTDVAAYEQCEDLKSQTLAAVAGLEVDIDELIVQMQQDDTDKWQAAFTQYSMSCNYVPKQYCLQMVWGGSSSCFLSGDQCVNGSD